MVGLPRTSQSMPDTSWSPLEIGVTSQQSYWVSVKGQPKVGRMKPQHGQSRRLLWFWGAFGGFPGTILLPQGEEGLPSFPVAPEFTAFMDKPLKLQWGRKQDWAWNLQSSQVGKANALRVHEREVKFSLLPAPMARKGKKIIRLPAVVWYLGEGVHPSLCLRRDVVLPNSFHSQGERQQGNGPRTGSSK